MELVPLTPELNAVWNEFCLKSSDAWFLHTTDWLSYNLNYRPELEPSSLSFLCRENGKTLAVVPLVLTHHKQDGREWQAFTLSGNSIPGPALKDGLTPSERDDAFDLIFSAIDGMAAELGVSYARFRIEALRPAMRAPRYAPCNYLLRHNFIDCSTNTQVIDLRISRNDLRTGLRRNHQRSIEKARELFRIRLHSGSELTDAKFDEYIAMHASAAGRTTRPRATFDMMRHWIQSGRGLVAEAVANDGKTAGFELYAMYKNAAVGLSACNEPEYKHLPIRHLIEWESIQWLRGKGVEFYEVGRQQFGILPYDFPEKKNMDISHFKYGFGGATIPYFEAERFYSQEHWLAEQRLRNEMFATRYPWKSESGGEEGSALLRRFNNPPTPGADINGSAEPPDDLLPISESALSIADLVVRENPESVMKCAAGNAKALHFLVGQALRRAGAESDPRQLRRAVEMRVAEAIAAGKQT